MSLLQRIKWEIKSFLEGHPLGYYIGNKVVNFSSVFLPHEEDFYGFRQLALNSNGLFLDIGANDGKSARSFRKLIKSWRILSIEANPLHQNTLQQLKRKIKNFDFIIGAIGRGDQALTLYTPNYKKIVIHSAASVELEQVKRQMKKQFKKQSIVDKIHYTKTATKLIHLDALNLTPDIIKIDIEGMEHAALESLQKTIEKKLPHILIEYNPINYNQVKIFLTNRGYVARGYNIKNHEFETFNTTHRNCFFIHESKIRRP